MEDFLEQSFTVSFQYKVHFTTGLFSIENTLLNQFFAANKPLGVMQKILFVADNNVLEHHSTLPLQIQSYFDTYPRVQPIADIVEIAGGEGAKNDSANLDKILEAVNNHGVDRHSYLCAIGGGSVLDLAGLAAAIAHRGIRHIRIPTTVLSQNDSGVGVKNSMNYFGKKNFIGTFAPPVAVFNDDVYLTTLSDRDWRSGTSEAVKVALVKDAVFFDWLEAHAADLANRNLPAMNHLIKRCAELHLQHIRSGDPFEMGSARPLDFGHWSAHKLEQMTNYQVLHGEAVAMGIALDSMYSTMASTLSTEEAMRILQVLQTLGFALTHPMLQPGNNDSPILKGLEEFREHLGGRLTITVLQAIGQGVEVHEIDTDTLREAAARISSHQLLV